MTKHFPTMSHEPIEEQEEAFDWAAHLKEYLRTDEETNIQLAFQFLTSLEDLEDEELFEMLRSSDMKICYCLKHEFLKPLVGVTKLDLHTWNVQDVLPQIPVLTKLQELNLAQCEIKQLPRGFCDLKDLQVLNLAFNRLTELPKDFPTLVKLVELDLERNPIHTLPEGFWHLTKLKRLSLEDTHLKEIGGIMALQDLEELDIRDSDIAALPEAIGELKHLKVLKIARTPIKTLPDSLRQLQNLELLYIGGLEDITLPEWILELTSLKEISLEKSQISEDLEARLRAAMPTLELKF